MKFYDCPEPSLEPPDDEMHDYLSEEDWQAYGDQVYQALRDARLEHEE